MPPPLLLRCFVSGLNLEIRHEVQALQHMTLVHVAGLARLQEEKLHEHRKHLHDHMPPISPLPSPSSPIVPSPTPNLPLLPSPVKPPPLPLKRLTPEELDRRREYELCFNCDEKFTRGHRCASQFFLLVADEEQDDTISSPKIANNDPNPVDPPHTDTQPNPSIIHSNHDPLQA